MISRSKELRRNGKHRRNKSIPLQTRRIGGIDKSKTNSVCKKTKNNKRRLIRKRNDVWNN